ncbi:MULTISPECIES: hypothetical protein [unclassified Endozoicomonas]|uniref:hypothetical protein n=1 Tax=unclassified Endozoicomonas TaxID=2644528 RepID=UPI003BB80D09
MKLDITSFTGEVPWLDSHLLEDTQAETAIDCRLTNGSLRAYRASLDEQVLNDTPKTIYLYRNEDERYWFDWTTDVDVIRSPVADDPNNRVYFTGSVKGPRYTDNGLALSGGSDYPVNDLQLGIPEPDVAPVVSLSGTPLDDAEEVDAETRFYTYTWVDQNGREGPPSLPSGEIVVKPGETVDITVGASPGAVDLNITHYRIYTSTQVGVYQLCTQINNNGTVATDTPVGVTSVVDETPMDRRGDILETIGWVGPPSNLQGIVVLPGGVAVGFSGKELMFSEPYHLYAWPAAYRLAVDYEIRSLAVAANSVIIVTDGYPYVAFGTEPSAMTLERLDTAHACISKRSMVDMGDMALYASPDGLVRIAGGRADLMTRNIINPEDWRARFQPDTIHACFHDGRYFGFYGDSVNGGGFIFSPDSGTFTELGTYADACYRDLQDDSLYLAIGDTVKAWDKGSELMPYRWRSKVFQGKPAAFTSARIMADSYDNLGFRVFRDGELVLELQVASDRGFRLPAGRGSRWQFELEGTDTVTAVIVASSMAEL